MLKRCVVGGGGGGVGGGGGGGRVGGGGGGGLWCKPAEYAVKQANQILGGPTVPLPLPPLVIFFSLLPSVLFRTVSACCCLSEESLELACC